MNPPDKIYLQWFGDEKPIDDVGPSDEDVTWSRERVFDLDFVYVRADSVVKVLRYSKSECRALLNSWGGATVFPSGIFERVIVRIDKVLDVIEEKP